MSAINNEKGSCLCGSVRFEVEGVKKEFGACHCEMCRKWTGGPLLSVSAGSMVNFEGSENISVYDSSPWAERGFCSKCGSGLFYRLKSNQHYMIPMGLFDNCDEMVFNLQVYIDKKPNCYSFAEQTNTMTEAEVIAMYAPDKN